MRFVQIDISKRENQLGCRIYWSFEKWQCNATQGQMTATAWFIFSRSNVVLLAALHLLKPAPANN